jgi:hypothetical protein
VGGVKLVVTMSGGLVHEIYSNVPAEVLIVDSDVEGCDEVKRITEWDFKKNAPSEETFEAIDASPWDAFIEPAAVEHYFSEMEKESEVRENADEVAPEVQEDKGIPTKT